MRTIFLLLLICLTVPAIGQDHVRSFGIFGGVSVPITFDDGLRKDPRFRNKITFRGIPIGFSYGYDYHNFGFVITPSYVQVGQQYIISNITGGDVGIRDIKMDYISVPVAFKLHLINFSFVRVNLVAALGVSYLLNGQETLTFSASTLDYPKGVRVPEEPGYEIKPDGGVATPGENNKLYVSKDKFNSIQIFVGLGARFDIDISEKWGINIDVRAHYGLLDPRKSDYKRDLGKSVGAPDLNGMRRDTYLSAELGIARIISIQHKRHIKTSDNKPIKRQQYKRPKW